MADYGNIKQALFFALMVIAPYVAHRIRRRGAASAVKEYPELAKKLGLSWRSPSGGGIGALSGEMDGYRVYVDPDDRARLVVYTRTAPELVLRTFEHEKRSPAGMVTATAGRAGLFKEAFAAEETAHALEERESELEALLRPFSERFPRTVSQLSITAERLECAFDFGRPSHIPGDVVEALLPAAIALVRFLESLGSGGPLARH